MRTKIKNRNQNLNFFKIQDTQHTRLEQQEGPKERMYHIDDSYIYYDLVWPDRFPHRSKILDSSG